MQLRPGDVDVDAVRANRRVLGGRFGDGGGAGAPTISELLVERASLPHTVLDLDYRPVLWTDANEARQVIGDAIDHATVAIGNRAECEIAVGTRDPDEAATATRSRPRRRCRQAGGDGVLVATSDGSDVVPPQPVEVVRPRAGDAFGGAFVHGLSGWPPERTVAYANAAGAIVASRLLCADAMPTNDEILTTLGRAERDQLSSESVAGGGS